MGERVLITGGAGFIGSHTADALLERGYEVRVLDNLHPQVHGNADGPPGYLSPDVEFRLGDVRDRNAVDGALNDVDHVLHLAAETGVGQSMYEIERYVDVNVRGTAVVWDAVATHRDRVRRLVLSSSRAVYGEGSYQCDADGAVFPGPRRREDLARADFSMRCPVCGNPVRSVPTPEESPSRPGSVYAQTKRFQEDISQLMSAVHGVPTVALRYFNVYGSRQALANPYTGVLATFGTRALAGSPILIYEAGAPRRDFVHVHDVVRANLLALDLDLDGGPAPRMRVFNVGAGVAVTLDEVARAVCAALGREPSIELTNRHRVGDILDCHADLTRSRGGLGYEPRVGLHEGVGELAKWLGAQSPQDLTEQVADELRAHGLLLDPTE